jgi:hypothetical protein
MNFVRRYVLPSTVAGWVAVALVGLFLVLQAPIPGVLAGAAAAVALARFHERSVLVWLSLVPTLLISGLAVGYLVAWLS